MATKEEQEAAEKAELEAAEKKAAEEKEQAEKAKEQGFENWLKNQPENVQKMYLDQVGGLKSALDKEREANKSNKGAAEKLAKLEKEAEEKRKAELSESERLKLEKDQAEKKAAALELKDMQRTAADKAGLPAEFADRLKGTTPEEMAEDAKKLLEAMPKQEKKKQEKINNNAPSSEGKDAAEMTSQEKSDFLFGPRSPLG